MSKRFALFLLIAMLLSSCAAPALDEAKLAAEGWVKNPVENGYVLLEELPAPRTEEGNYAADASSINATNLYNYMGRNDVTYIDLRDYEDYARKHLKNFEVIPYFALIFNENAGKDDAMVQLFSGTPEEPVAVYQSSEAILNELFPKDETLFLMCQSGGRVAMMMEILEEYGYDMNKVYNVGGLGQFTDAGFESYITDTEEFALDVDYQIEGAIKH